MNNPKKVLLSPLLESFESNGSRYDGRVSTRGRDLSNWESFGYYTGWLLHCDRSKRRLDRLLEGALSRVEIPALRQKDFTRFRMEWIATGDVDCDQPEHDLNSTGPVDFISFS